MPDKPLLEEHLYDFGAGMDDTTHPAKLADAACQVVSNFSVDAPSGLLRSQGGSRYVVDSALGAEISGIAVWNASGTPQIVVLADGDLHYKSVAFGGSWTTVSPTPAIDNGQVAYFATNRDNTSGAPLYLYVADGTNYWRWSGSALTQLSGTASLPSNVDMVRAYHVRNWLRSTDYENNVWWTVLGDPEDGAQDVGVGAGSAMVDVLRGDPIVAMEVVGGSLLLGTRNSVVRFTGYDSSDIQISQDTEGISSTIGPVARNGFTRVEKWTATVSNSGLYAISEDDLTLLSRAVSKTVKEMSDVLTSATAVFHEGKREVWFLFRDSASGLYVGSHNTTILVYNLQMRCWYMYSDPAELTCATLWTDTDGTEYVVAGATNGYVYVLDYGNSLLQTAAGVAGSSLTGAISFRPIYFRQGNPSTLKQLAYMTFQVRGTSGSALYWRVQVDEQNEVVLTNPQAISATDELITYRVDLGDVEQGRRFDFRLITTETAPTVRLELHGFSVYAHDTGRVT